MNNARDKGWKAAVGILDDWERNRGHLDELLDQRDPGGNRWLVREVFRNWLLIEQILKERVRKPPRPVTLNILRLAVAECLARGEQAAAQIVHFAVQEARRMQLSASECRFINAVMRGIVRDGTLARTGGLRDTHPQWLVDHWMAQFGEGDTLKFLEWNQTIPGLTIVADDCPRYAEKTEWSGYFRVKKGCIEEAIGDLHAGKAYAQDPFARIPVELLDVQLGETVLDLCAAPGGKTRQLAKATGQGGRVLAVDRPGRRLQRLEGNIRNQHLDNVVVYGSRLETVSDVELSRLTGSNRFSAVLIDVPCSNTGVMQKRPDVKLRLRPDDFDKQAAVQLELLGRAAHLTAPGGRLVYSTCSVEKRENTAVVEAFLQAHPGWKLGDSVISYPWRCGHDGGGAFLLTKRLSD